MTQDQASRPAPALSSGLPWLMTVTCTVTVANPYYAQPLLHAIGAALHLSQAAAALLVTAGQVGYAALFALVGAAGALTAAFGGRLLDARRQLRWPVTGAALALMAASFALIGLGGARLGAWSLVLLE